MAERSVKVRLWASTTEYESAMRRAKGATSELTGEIDSSATTGTRRADQLGAAFSRMGQVVAGLGIAEGMRRSIDAASDLEESVNAVNVTFGDAANGVLGLAENAATGVGLAASEFNGLAVQFSAFAKDVAGPGGDVVGIIDDLTTRSADFASVMNLDVTEAARVFSSTLAGESEPIKRYGIIIDDAAVKARALEMGLADTAAEVTAQDKVMARYALLMDKTAASAGDFANTSDSLANQQRILKAELTNAAAAIGQELLPMAATAAGALGDFVGVLGDMPSAARQFTVGAAAVVVGLTTIGTKATATLGLLGLVAGEVSALSAGIKGDMDFLNKDASLFEKPFQLAGQFGFALGAGEWGAWKNEALDALNAAEAAAAAFDGTLLSNVGTVEEARTVVLEWADGLGLSEEATLHAANVVTAKYAPGIRDATSATEEMTEAVDDQISAAEIIQYEIDRAATNVRRFGSDGVENMGAVEEATDDAADSVVELATEWDILKGKLSDEAAFLSLQDQFDGVEEAAKDAWTAAAEGSEDAEAKARDYEQATIDLKIAVGDYATEIGGIPDEVVSKLIADIDDGKAAEVEEFLRRWAQGINVPLRVYPSIQGGGQRFMDSGGFGRPGDIVAERRPEFVGGSLVTSPTMLTAANVVTGGESTEKLIRQFIASGGSNGPRIGVKVDKYIDQSGYGLDDMFRQANAFMALGV